MTSPYGVWRRLGQGQWVVAYVFLAPAALVMLGVIAYPLLDGVLRVKMSTEIARLHNRLGVTMAYVTHDQVEAMTLADRIVVLDDGRIRQVGTPMELCERTVGHTSRAEAAAR